MFRVQVSCWCWKQARSIRDALPQFRPLIEDWWPLPAMDQDLIDQIMAEDAQPQIVMFFDVGTNEAVDAVIEVATANERELTIGDRQFKPSIHVEREGQPWAKTIAAS